MNYHFVFIRFESDPLVLSLPDAYSLFHNVEWAVSRESADLHGEIDIIVMNQSGDLLLVEVKSGAPIVFSHSSCGEISGFTPPSYLRYFPSSSTPLTRPPG